MKTPSPLRKLLINPAAATPQDLRGKKAIVTGAALGSLGFGTALTLARWGASVTVTTRSASQQVAAKILEELRNERVDAEVDAHDLDLSLTDSVTQFADWYRSSHGDQLDILINNAGVHLDLLSQWKAPNLLADGFEIHWRTNYLGTMHLTHLLLPLLQRAGQSSGDARIVNVVSQLHKMGRNAALFAPLQPYNSWAAYGTSKLGMVHATYEIQRRYAQSSHVQAYCLHPGAVSTNIAGKGLDGNRRLEAIRKALAPVESLFMLTPEEGAQTQLHCATAPGLGGGLYYQKCRARPSSAESQDTEVAARLWQATDDWVKSLA